MSQLWPKAGGGPPTPDATDTEKGKLKLAGDLGGTADLPTVPGLQDKADLVDGKVPEEQLPDGLGGGGGPVPVVADLAAEAFEEGKTVFWQPGGNDPGYKMRAVRLEGLFGLTSVDFWSYEGSTMMGTDGRSIQYPDESTYDSDIVSFPIYIPRPSPYTNGWHLEYGFTGTGEMRPYCDIDTESGVVPVNSFPTLSGPSPYGPPCVGDGGSSSMVANFSGPAGEPVHLVLDLESGGTYEWIWLKLKPVMFVMDLVA